MENTNLYKKDLSKKDKEKIIDGSLSLINLNTGEIIEPLIQESNYNLKLSNKKEFMKTWTDRKLNLTIRKDLSLIEKEMILDIISYTDTDNIINFRLLANDYGYSASKITKARKLLEGKMLVKKKDGIYYLNPLVGIKTKNISQDLIKLFKDSFDRYKINITL